MYCHSISSVNQFLQDEKCVVGRQYVFPTIRIEASLNLCCLIDSNGSVEHWHITSGKCLHAITNEENQLYALDYRADGSMFATAGRDTAIRVYDEATKTEIACMKGGHGAVTAGHSNRIFSMKFHPTDENVLLSGGWDNTIQIWDLRVKHAVRGIYGPHIAGDALDIKNDEILTGSWRPENPLELWDYGTGKPKTVIPWNQSAIKTEPCFLYSAQFSKDPNNNLIAAGGSGANEAKVFNHAQGNKVGDPMLLPVVSTHILCVSLARGNNCRIKSRRIYVGFFAKRSKIGGCRRRRDDSHH